MTRATTDKAQITKNHTDIARDLLRAHAFLGWDIVTCYFGNRKGAFVWSLQAGHAFSALGAADSS